MAEFTVRVDTGHIEIASWWQMKEARNKWNWDHQSDSAAVLAVSERGQQWNTLGPCRKDLKKEWEAHNQWTRSLDAQEVRKIENEVELNSTLGHRGFHWEDKWQEVYRAVSTGEVLKQLWNVWWSPWQRWDQRWWFIPRMNKMTFKVSVPGGGGELLCGDI